MGIEYPCGCMMTSRGDSIKVLSIFPCQEHFPLTEREGDIRDLAMELIGTQGKPVNDEQVQGIPQERSLVPQEEAEAPPNAAL